ncbi:MAG: hypothetical protein A4E59_01164 [Syntrophorhabdus sp. PtaB.Bin027]|nr:MAG: hypothetical protein A4E59_01164 [Syntrophorhabdus sp. PtaB.Bin027]
MPPAVDNCGDIGDTEQCAEKYLGYVVVKVAAKRTEIELSPHHRDECSRTHSRLPVPCLPDKDKHHRDHQCPKNRGEPERDLRNFSPRGSPGDHAHRGRKPGKERPPRDILAGGKEGHRLEPGVPGEVDEHLLGLPEVVHGVVHCDDVEHIAIQCEEGKGPDPQRE